MDEQRKNEMLDLAKQLVEDIENDNGDAAQEQLEELSKMRDADLFQELGKLTRQLHESLNNFQVDSKISFIAENEIPDAKARLNHVIDMTEDSANRTMTAIESAMPLSEKLESDSHKYHEEWKRFRNRELSVEDFRKMSNTLDEFFPDIARRSREINSYMTEIMMAQDFQDLTGQIIRRVINLVQEVEESLVELVKISGKKLSDKKDEVPEEDKSGGHGPQVPGVDHGNTVSGQDDVDDLLSSLGF